MIEERLKITNLEDRLKSEMGAGAGDMNNTAEALRLALQQEERLKLELGNLKSMESLLGGAGIARMMQMMDNTGDKTSFPPGLGSMSGHHQTSSWGLESGPGSSSGSVPPSPKHPEAVGGHQSSLGQISPDQLQGGHQRLRNDVELTKVTGSEASLQYQRDIGAHIHTGGYRQQQMNAAAEAEMEEEAAEAGEEVVYRKEVGDAVSVYPKDMSSGAMQGLEGHMEAPLVYPQSPVHYPGLPQVQGSD